MVGRSATARRQDQERAKRRQESGHELIYAGRAAFVSFLAMPGAGELIRAAVRSWPGVEAVPHRFRGTEYRLFAKLKEGGRRERASLRMSTYLSSAFLGRNLPVSGCTGVAPTLLCVSGTSWTVIRVGENLLPIGPAPA